MLDGMELTQVAQQQMKVSPRLVAMNHILELSSMQLQELINAEVDENPALELIETQTCSVCGAVLQNSFCEHCMTEAQKSSDSTDVGNQDPDYMTREDYYYEEGASMARRDPEDDFDPLTLVAAEMSLHEHLLRELGSVLTPEQMPIAEYIVGNLDERGYLEISTDEIAYNLGCSEEEVEAVLRELQRLEPVGIGARDLEECLRIQLDFLREQGVSCPYAREIVTEHLAQLGEHKYSRIAHGLHVATEVVAEAAEFIKHHLNPFPAHGFHGGSRPDGSQQGYVLPDVIIRRRDKGFEVDVVESKRFYLRINPLYRDLMTRAQAESASLSDQDRRHIQQYVSRARLFMANIDQRRQTLQKIASFLISYQRGFLDHGVRHLRPLTRAMVAQELGIHESTVSRAIASKFVMLPSGEVIPLSNFFTPSLSVKDVIKDMIEHESTPLTDEQIANELGRRGYPVARRTVAKYREQLGILPSILR